MFCDALRENVRQIVKILMRGDDDDVVPQLNAGIPVRSDDFVVANDTRHQAVFLNFQFPQRNIVKFLRRLCGELQRLDSAPDKTV